MKFMSDTILNHRANFYGFESIDSADRHHYHPAALRGGGELLLTKKEVRFNQWMTSKEYRIAIHQITKVEIKGWHNMKMKWPRKVLRIFYKEEDGIKIFGATVGGRYSISKGWQDEAFLWKENIESLLE